MQASSMPLKILVSFSLLHTVSFFHESIWLIVSRKKPPWPALMSLLRKLSSPNTTLVAPV